MNVVDLLAYEFIQNALIAGILASVLCGVVGTFVVVKRLVFISGGISHAAFGGLGAAYWLGVNPIIGAVVVSVLCAVVLARSEGGREASRDALIGVLWAVGMAVGIVFISRTPGYAPDLMTYLFGNILTVTRTDLVVSLVLNSVVIGIVLIFFKELVAVSFDETFAQVQGVPVRTMLTVLLVLVSLSIVLLIQIVGVVLVMALLTVPPLIALRLVDRLFSVLLVAISVGLMMTLCGLGLSYLYDVPSGPAITLLGAAALWALVGWQRFFAPNHLEAGESRDLH